jgi:hypothetical protein
MTLTDKPHAHEAFVPPDRLASPLGLVGKHQCEFEGQLIGVRNRDASPLFRYIPQDTLNGGADIPTQPNTLPTRLAWISSLIEAL